MLLDRGGLIDCTGSTADLGVVVDHDELSGPLREGVHPLLVLLHHPLDDLVRLLKIVRVRALQQLLQLLCLRKWENFIFPESYLTKILLLNFFLTMGHSFSCRPFQALLNPW